MIGMPDCQFLEPKTMTSATAVVAVLAFCFILDRITRQCTLSRYCRSFMLFLFLSFLVCID
ncbi:MAG: hypothetical protein J3Q66DRAFT_321391 [Benniella sp.]|nr:MAG: hypothetical protein J3Q66DRAFT_321391 [Benniella sp.]